MSHGESQQTVTVGAKSFAAMADELRRLHAEDYAQPPAGSFTAAQYGEVNGWSQDTAAGILRRLASARKVKAVGRFRSVSGRVATFYQITPRK